jgi:hypothetical protein
VDAGVGAGGGEFRPRLLQRRGVVDGNRARGRHHVEEPGERQVGPGHRCEQPRVARAVVAGDDREVRNRDVELLPTARRHVQEDVDALRARRGWLHDEQRDENDERGTSDEEHDTTTH